MVAPAKRFPKSIRNKTTVETRRPKTFEDRSRINAQVGSIRRRRETPELTKSLEVIPERQRKRKHKVRPPSRRPVVLRTPQDSMTVEVAVNDRVTFNPIDVSIPTLLTYFSFCVGVIIAFVHVTDFLFEWPFHRFYIAQDIAFFACGAALAWLSWSTLKERRH